MGMGVMGGQGWRRDGRRTDIVEMMLERQGWQEDGDRVVEGWGWWVARI